MTGDSPPRLGAYARAIERRWSQLTDGPVILSARDWQRITDWHDRGIPLQIVYEAMESVVERRARSPVSRTLSRVAPVLSKQPVHRSGSLTGIGVWLDLV